MEKTCSVEGCGGKHRARGFCQTHYFIERRLGHLPAKGREPAAVRPCVHCGEPIPAWRTRSAIFCGPLCKRQAQYEKEKTEPPAYRNEPCSVDGCGSARFGRGLCQKHYGRLRSKGSTDDVRKNARPPCSVEGCQNPNSAQGLCDMHRDRVRRAEERVVRLAARPARTCLGCGGPLRPDQRTETLFCSRKCKDVERRRTGRTSDAGLKYYYRANYGMTRAEIAALLVSQDGKCAICGVGDAGGRHGNFHVDHDHETGRVRGMLCHSCNIALGHFKDDPSVLQSAIDYLHRVPLVI